MFKRMILMNPDPAASGGGAIPTPAPAPAPAPAAPSGFPSATSLLKLSAPPSGELEERTAALRARLPASVMPKPNEPATPPAPAPAPAAPAAPEPAPAPAPTPATPPAPQKFKFRGREYTEEEFEAEIARTQSPAPAPAPAPAAPAPTQDPAAVAAQQAQENARALREENAWVADRLPRFEPFVAVSAEEAEAILVGGPEGAVALTTALRKTAAAAELQARKSIYSEMAPIYKELQDKVESLVTQNQRAVQEQAEIRFFSTPERADYRQHADLCRQAAGAIVAQYPEWVQNASEEQFFAEIAKQVDFNLNQNLQRIFGHAVDWRTLRQQSPASAAAPAPAPTPTPAPAPAAPAPAAPAAPAVTRAPVATPFAVSHHLQNPGTVPPAVIPGNPAHNVSPPSVNAPAGGGFAPPSADAGFHSSVNARMRTGR